MIWERIDKTDRANESCDNNIAETFASFKGHMYYARGKYAFVPSTERNLLGMPGPYVMWANVLPAGSPWYMYSMQCYRSSCCATTDKQIVGIDYGIDHEEGPLLDAARIS